MMPILETLCADKSDSILSPNEPVENARNEIRETNFVVPKPVDSNFEADKEERKKVIDIALKKIDESMKVQENTPIIPLTSASSMESSQSAQTTSSGANETPSLAEDMKQKTAPKSSTCIVSPIRLEDITPSPPAQPTISTQQEDVIIEAEYLSGYQSSSTNAYSSQLRNPNSMLSATLPLFHMQIILQTPTKLYNR